MITSSRAIMPRSPWLASVGWTKNAWVPVEASVAAILRPICPLLPMPLTMTRPLLCRIVCTASSNADAEAALERRARLLQGGDAQLQAADPEIAGGREMREGAS